MRFLPPFDMHAHINPAIDARQLEKLGAVVFAATRSMGEFEQTLYRRDLVTIWGVGCHPELAAAQTSFNRERFTKAMSRTPFVCEVGLDGRSGVPMEHQIDVFRSILLLSRDSPRIMSIHSRRATKEVLDLVEETGAQGVVMHWWLGAKTETARAIELGCYFSINRNMCDDTESLSQIPPNRLLTETDHPSGNRKRRGLSQPGWTYDVEDTISEVFKIKPSEVRTYLWTNLSALVDKSEVRSLLPIPVQSMLTSAAKEPRET